MNQAAGIDRDDVLTIRFVPVNEWKTYYPPAPWGKSGADGHLHTSPELLLVPPRQQ